MRRSRRSLFALLAAVYCCSATLHTSADDAQPLTFERHVRPILKAHCFHCHGELEEHEGDLDLRLVRLMAAGGDSGPAIVPGKAAESLLIERLAAGEMPPEGKPLPETDLAVIRAWIDQGAKTTAPEPEPTAISDITEAERAWWSFQPIASPPLPDLDAPADEANQHRSPIDAFLLAELQKHNIVGFSPAADKHTLVRRAYFDLVGLPPSPDEVDAFVNDASPDAWERLIDRLLAMPQYGERWGRHWLDVAGYADSDGYTEKDVERKYAYKYRDYVIRSFNVDRPWDGFIRAQLAGDELLLPPYTNLSPDQADLLAATGLLRMAPDGTADGSVDQMLARNDVLAETIKIVSSSLLGLTVGCAQCHNHRYDPIPQADYYRFRALLEPAYDTKNWRKPNERLVSLWNDETLKTAKALRAELNALNEERQAALDKIVADIFEAEVAKLPEEQRELARKAKDTPAKDRTAEQQQILKDHPSLNVSRGSAYLYEGKRVNEHNKQFDERAKAIADRVPPDDMVPCLTEVPDQAPPTFVFYRGDLNQPRDEVQPGELSVIASASHAIPADDPDLPTTGRRLAYARWLTSGEHPLVARVLVNRFWLHHFGRGIVATPADFGMLGEKPSHPELLDWLAARFMHDGWELKRLQRLIMSSAAYRQSSQRTDELDAIDPDNRLLGRMSIRRLEAEAIRDSILAASGLLNTQMLGPPAPVTVDEVGQVIVGNDNRDSAGRPQGKRGSLGGDELRRSVYVQVRRSLPLSMLEAFDAPTLTPNCELRNRSTVAPQSLLLMNNPLVIEHALALAERVQRDAADDVRAQVLAAWRLALATEPADEQIESATAFVTGLAEQLAAEPTSEKEKEGLPSAETRALAAYCQALFSSNAFLYVD
jgi:hypothetical protein